jgi:hypothetical protein
VAALYRARTVETPRLSLVEIRWQKETARVSQLYYDLLGEEECERLISKTHSAIQARTWEQSDGAASQMD